LPLKYATRNKNIANIINRDEYNILKI